MELSRRDVILDQQTALCAIHRAALAAGEDVTDPDGEFAELARQTIVDIGIVFIVLMRRGTGWVQVPHILFTTEDAAHSFMKQFTHENIDFRDDWFYKLEASMLTREYLLEWRLSLDEQSPAEEERMAEWFRYVYRCADNLFAE
jgi:hypothetical protein